jgi:hypothetical protein
MPDCGAALARAARESGDVDAEVAVSLLLERLRDMGVRASFEPMAAGVINMFATLFFVAYIASVLVGCMCCFYSLRPRGAHLTWAVRLGSAAVTACFLAVMRESEFPDFPATWASAKALAMGTMLAAVGWTLWIHGLLGSTPVDRGASKRLEARAGAGPPGEVCSFCTRAVGGEGGLAAPCGHAFHTPCANRMLALSQGCWRYGRGL